jgi:hypothetical protein
MARTTRASCRSLLRYHRHIRSTNNTSHSNSQLHSYCLTHLQFIGDLRIPLSAHDSESTMAKAKEYSLLGYNTIFSGDDTPTPDNQLPASSQGFHGQSAGNGIAAYDTPTPQTMSPMFDFPSPVPEFNDVWYDLPNLASWDGNDERVPVQLSSDTVLKDVTPMTQIDPMWLEFGNYSTSEMNDPDGGYPKSRSSSTGLPTPHSLHSQGELPSLSGQAHKDVTSNGGATYMSPYPQTPSDETNDSNVLAGYPSPARTESVSTQSTAHAQPHQCDGTSAIKAAILGMHASKPSIVFSHLFLLSCTISSNMLTCTRQISLPHCMARASKTKRLASTPSLVHAGRLRTQ